MHHLLAAIFAVLFSASHSATTSVARQATAPQAYAVAVNDRNASRLATPRLSHVSSYAGSTCVSCRRTNVSYRVR